MPHPSRGADGEGAELRVPPCELVAERGEDPTSRCPERVSEGDRAAEHVEARGIDFTDRVREARPLCPLARGEAEKVAEHLRGERLVHLHEVDVTKRDARTPQRH